MARHYFRSIIAGRPARQPTPHWVEIAELVRIMPLSPWTRLGPYEMVSRIGAGGMGEVWKARDHRLDRTVAIKSVQEQFSDRFEREARAIAALNPAHICQLYDVGPNDLVMEYIEGKPLAGPLTRSWNTRARFARRSKLRTPKALFIATSRLPTFSSPGPA